MTMTDGLQLCLTLVVVAQLYLLNRSPRPAASMKRSRVILDSCALIDGRVVALNQLGFLDCQLIVPEFIIRELQMLADGGDAQKRERARYGLDNIKQLQEAARAVVVIDRTQVPSQPTDDKLLFLAKRLSASLFTTDFNLQKVAAIEGVTILNVNELSQELRPSALPGEHRTVTIVQKGSSRKQGVGYFDDGTMVVVDNAQTMLQKTVEVEIIRMHQTMAGKMVFATLLPTQSAKHPSKKSPISVQHKSRQTNSKSS